MQRSHFEHEKEMQRRWLKHEQEKAADQHKLEEYLQFWRKASEEAIGRRRKKYQRGRGGSKTKIDMEFKQSIFQQMSEHTQQLEQNSMQFIAALRRQNNQRENKMNDTQKASPVHVCM